MEPTLTKGKGRPSLELQVPWKAFAPRYEKYAKVYKETTFLKIVGNENESCKHYAKEARALAASLRLRVWS